MIPVSAMPLLALSFKAKLAAALLAFALLLVLYFVWQAHVYGRGYDDALKDVAARNAVATQSVRDAIEKVRACRDAGGAWDQPRGLCVR
jgi:ABC-type bacteriocin/lantibiotic exporter with double-glycine peptidase domain